MYFNPLKPQTFFMYRQL